MKKKPKNRVKRIATRTHAGQLHRCPGCKDKLFVVDETRPAGVRPVKAGATVRWHPGDAPWIRCPCGQKSIFCKGSI